MTTRPSSLPKQAKPPKRVGWLLGYWQTIFAVCVLVALLCLRCQIPSMSATSTVDHTAYRMESLELRCKMAEERASTERSNRLHMMGDNDRFLARFSRVVIPASDPVYINAQLERENRQLRQELGAEIEKRLLIAKEFSRKEQMEMVGGKLVDLRPKPE